MTFRVDVNTGSALVPVWYDVSSFVRSWGFSRGRDRFLSGFSAGSCEVTFDNRLRTFDPLNGSSPVQSAVVPRAQVRLFPEVTDVVTSRTNLIVNPSFETGVGSWASTGTGLSQTDAYSVFGTYSAWAGGTSFFAPIIESAAVSVTAGETYTASVYVRVQGSVSGTIGIPMNVTIVWDSGALSSAQITLSSGVWRRLSVTGVAPTGVTTAQLQVSGATTFTGNPTVWIDGAMFEQSATLNNYFDGSITSDGYLTYAWTGTAHASTSTATGVTPTGVAFTGFVDDWTLNYDVGGDSTASLQASDAFTLLANQNVPDQTMPLELTGDRITRLSDFNNLDILTAAPDVDSGNRYLTTDTTDGDNALSYFQQIALTELGELYIGKAGQLVYRDSDVNNPSPADVVATFADDGTGIAFQTIAVEYGSEQLTNRFTVTWVGGDVQDDNTASQALYGVTEGSATTLAQNLTDAASLAGYYVNRFGQPLYRIQQVSMYVPNLSPSDRATVLALELGDVVLVKFTPNGLGSSIDQYAKVTRISQSGEGVEHYITFGLEAFTTFPFVLGDATYGELGSTYVLGF